MESLGLRVESRSGGDELERTEVMLEPPEAALPAPELDPLPVGCQLDYLLAGGIDAGKAHFRQPRHGQPSLAGSVPFLSDSPCSRGLTENGLRGSAVLRRTARGGSTRASAWSGGCLLDVLVLVHRRAKVRPPADGNRKGPVGVFFRGSRVRGATDITRESAFQSGKPADAGSTGGRRR